ncbi:hypothetical protein AGMMS49991_08490 [Spirochaetia bacterium]|nr:hypothetical protein AGMMS49991_08490 [Spirochaetia bacterium]
MDSIGNWEGEPNSSEIYWWGSTTACGVCKTCSRFVKTGDAKSPYGWTSPGLADSKLSRNC